MSSSAVSIVIPTFNRAVYLKQCIEAAISQTYNCEIVVVDHGSTDNTPEIAKSFGNRINYIRREHDSGVHFSWLDGVISAKGEFVHINYDDDWIEPEYIEKCMLLMDSETGYVFSNTRLYNDITKEYSEPIFSVYGKTGTFSIKKMKTLAQNGLISPGCILMRRSDLLDALFVGAIPYAKFHYKGVGADLLFTLMPILKYKKAGFVEEALAVFRVHESSITVNALNDQDRTIKLNKAYDEARHYYWLSVFVKRFKIMSFVSFYLKVRRKINSIKK